MKKHNRIISTTLLICSLLIINTLIVFAASYDIELFPTPQQIESGNGVMIENTQVINRVVFGGTVNDNKGTINSLEGGTVEVNSGTIENALAGIVKNNNGTITKVYGNAITINSNNKGAIIKENYETINNNVGEVTINYGTIEENSGNIDHVMPGGKVNKFVEGTINTNEGTAYMYANSDVNIAKIENNKGLVNVCKNQDGEGTAIIENNTGKIDVGQGAKCQVLNNNGTIEVQPGAMVQVGANDPSGTYYKLVLDNIAPEDFTILSNYKIDDPDGDGTYDIYVLGGDNNFTFSYDKSKYYLLWSADETANTYSVSAKFLNDNYPGKNYVDDINHILKLHFHTKGSYEPDEGGKHKIMCASCGEVAEIENCSGGNATCISKAVCEYCNQPYGSLGGHTYGGWITDIDSTYDTEGTKHRECIYCSDKETGVIPVKTKSSRKKKKTTDDNVETNTSISANINSNANTNKFNFDYINCKKDNTCIVNNYTDVNSNEWYHDGIHFVLSNKIMIGTDTNIFDIDNKVTRAQIAMILYNIEGKPEVKNNESFSDVNKDMWYSDAISFLKDNKIINGLLDGTYHPDDELTCEELITILYNYSKFKNNDLKINDDTNFLSYNDFMDISDWANTPMLWALDNKIIIGTDDNNINPKENISRSRVATIITRFCVE